MNNIKVIKFPMFIESYGIDQEKIEFIAMDNDKITGHISLDVNEYSAGITWMFVEPTYQNQGIGKALMTDVIALCKDRELEAISLSVSSGNRQHNLIKYYKKFGFVISYEYDNGTVFMSKGV